MLLNVRTPSHTLGYPTWVEANTALLAILTAAKLNMNFVLFEGDAKVVIDALNFNSSPSWEVAATFANIHVLLSSFSSFYFLFGPYGQNGLAHSISWWASSCMTWRSDVASVNGWRPTHSYNDPNVL